MGQQKKKKKTYWITIKRSERGDLACAASRVSRACVALTLPGLPGVWKARSPRRGLKRERRLSAAAAEDGGVRAARAPPRGLFVVSGPHIAVV